MGPSWGQLGPFRAQLGPSKPTLMPICHPSCFLQALKTTTSPTNSHFASFLEVSWPTKSAINIVFNCFFQDLFDPAFLQHVLPTALLLNPGYASSGTLDASKRPQDGPQKWRPTTGKSCKIIPGTLLGPSWGRLWPSKAQPGLFQPFSKPT